MGPGLVVVGDPIVGVGAKASDGAVGCGGEADSVQAARAKTEAAIRANLGVTPCVCSPSRAYQRRPRYCVLRDWTPSRYSTRLSVAEIVHRRTLGSGDRPKEVPVRKSTLLVGFGGRIAHSGGGVRLTLFNDVPMTTHSTTPSPG